MDPPHGQPDAAQLERLVPGDGVLVHAVDEGPVEVEQEGRAVGRHGWKANPVVLLTSA